MSERMTDAFMEYVHGAVHASIEVSVAMLAERQGPDDRGLTAVSLENLMGPLAVGMFHQGIMFALRSPGAARAYDEMLTRDIGLDAADRRSASDELVPLEAAWRPLQ